MKITRIITLGIFLALLFAGCVGSVVKFNTMAEQPYDTARGREIRGSACGFQFYLFFPIMINDRAQRAYDRLVEAADGDYIADIKVNERWVYALIGTGYCTDLKATAYPKIAPTAAGVKAGAAKSTIDECIKACRENTNRSGERCFDECK